MAKILIWHKVKDFDTWKRGYDEDAPRRDGAGFKELGIHRGKIDSNSLVIELEGDPGVMEQMISDPQLKEKMQESGVESMDYYMY